MAAKIRLTRKGSKKRPYYWIVVADSRSPRDGMFIEKIGTYNPLAKPDDEKRVTLDVERARHWLSVGAQPSDRVAKFLDRFHVRKVGLRYNPSQGAPKEKARERAEVKGVRRTTTAFVTPLDEEEQAAAAEMMAALIAT